MQYKREISHSQNFINNNKIVKELLSISNINKNDLVIEIGPGKGIITNELLNNSRKVIAIERDPLLARDLEKTIKAKNFELILYDFLNYNLPNVEYKVFSNIPFNYTTDIISKLIDSFNPPKEIYFIMQQEAAYRYLGEPYINNSLVAILLSIDYKINILKNIASYNFTPKPNVNISFVKFIKRDIPYYKLANISDDEETLYRDFIVYGFTRWAPTIQKAYSNIFSRKQFSIMAKTQKVNNLKPTDLNIDQWTNLYKTFSKFVDVDKKNIIIGCEERLLSQQKNIDKIYRTRK